MRVVFFGSPPFAVASLDRLMKSPFKPLAVVTQPDKPKGRGREVEPSAIAKMAKAAGVELLQPGSASESAFLERMRALAPDVALVVSYGQILKDELLAIPKQGCFNLHASLLPRWRGASPIAAAILAGDRETGVCLQRMVRKLDAGDVVASKTVPIRPQDTTGDLTDLLGRYGAELLVETLPKIATGSASFTPQDESRASYAGKIRKEQGVIDWTKSAEEVDRHIRAMLPWPGASTMFPTKRGPLRVHVLAGTIEAGAAKEDAGKILGASASGIRIACGNGSFSVKALQPEGGKSMPVSAFLNGNAILPGTKVEPPPAAKS